MRTPVELRGVWSEFGRILGEGYAAVKRSCTLFDANSVQSCCATCVDAAAGASRPNAPRRSVGLRCRSRAARRRFASANQLDDAGNRIYRPATAYAMRALSLSSRRPPASDAVSMYGVRRVARDGSLQQPCFARGSACER